MTSGKREGDGEGEVDAEALTLGPFWAWLLRPPTLEPLSPRTSASRAGQRSWRPVAVEPA